MDTDRGAIKRSRSSSSSSDSSVASSSRSVSYSPPPKYHRASASPSKRGAFICDLPPTCSQPDSASSYATQQDLERHRDAFHKWICEDLVRDKSVPRDTAAKVMVECGKVFPEERLLTLHQTETHDPEARKRQEKGEKIFCCFLPVDQCTKRFLDPQRRRRHMVDKHHYPRDYFFSITNHGINQVALQEGLAMSLIRPRRFKLSARALIYKEKQRQGKKGGMKVDQSSAAKELPNESAHPLPDHSAPSSKVVDKEADVDMNGLITQLGNLDSSLQFKPRGLRKKTAAAMK